MLRLQEVLTLVKEVAEEVERERWGRPQQGSERSVTDKRSRRELRNKGGRSEKEPCSEINKAIDGDQHGDNAGPWPWLAR